MPNRVLLLCDNKRFFISKGVSFLSPDINYCGKKIVKIFDIRKNKSTFLSKFLIHLSISVYYFSLIWKNVLINYTP